ncbi:thiol reductant ABC exporter subunit CydC [Chryseomicrobium palamuruense]|uniref:Thiol reductant ABC exporter subunit CydC n=1 Tax=Chryseomicrobium palamuruense TaxID=682973 RepID=A0ABV8UYM1_9BACL
MQTLIDLLWHEKRDALYSVGLGALSGLTAVALFAMSGYMISKAALAPPFYTILILTSFLKLFGAVKSSSRYFERVISHRVTFQALSRIRLHFFEQLQPHVPQLFSKYRSGDLLARFVGDVEALQNFFLRVVYPPLVTAVVFLATIFFSLFFSVWIALALLIGILLVSVVIPVILSKRLTKYDVLEKRAALSTETAEYFAGYRDLRLHQQAKNKQQSLERLQHMYEQEQHRNSRVQVWSQTLNAGVASFSAFAVLAAGAYLVSTGELNGLYLAMLTLVALTSFESAIPLANTPTYFHESNQAMERLEFLDKEPLPIKDHSLLVAESYTLMVNQLIYSYPEALRPVLNNISLTFPAGSSTVIVGASGSGKSTLLQLLAGMIMPTSGEILYNGQDISNVQEESLWQQTGIQLQSSHFFYGTVRENLALAHASATDEELQQALEKAQLPLDLDASVFERGENLSGGEKQRLSLARLFLQRAKVWLLDEPFTSMDSFTEERLSSELKQHLNGGTVIMISHKLNGLEEVDQIVVMDHGEIKEVGSFEELVARQGLFYEMLEIENQIV